MNYATELTFATDLAREAGEIMRRYFRSENIGIEWKADNTPLTVADTAINTMVIERVRAAYPTHAVIGEESGLENNGDFFWVVDPIDGTVPFSLGMPISTFSLGLVSRDDGQPVIGVVYDPHLDHMYTAIRDEGAFLNQVQLHSVGVTDFKQTYTSVLGGNEKSDKPYFKQGACVDYIRERGGITLSLQSQVYSAVRVASGELAGSIFGYGSPWDSAAVALLVTEAGGVVTDIHGKARRYDDFAEGCVLAANETMLAKLLAAIQHAAI